MAFATSSQREIDPSTRIRGQRDASGLDLRQRSSRLLDRAVHFLSHRFILSRRRTTITRAAGLRLAVPPTVFHPRYFLTSEFLAAFIDGLDLADKRVADIGTGTGILALAAARSGAANVLAIDINPRAARAAAENARANGLASRVRPVCSDLFAGIQPGAQFEVILSNPPFFVGEPLDLADRAWHAGPDYRDIAPLFDQARARLAPGGSMYVVLSSHADLDLFDVMITRAGFRARLAAERSILIEMLKIYELRPADYSPADRHAHQSEIFLCSP
jgi:methylase of polypeptide subunit release factors